MVCLVCMKDFKNYNTYYPYNMSGEYDKSLHQAICLDLEDNDFLQGLSTCYIFNFERPNAVACTCRKEF